MMDTHEYADIFPMMNSKEFNDLKTDIKNNGQMQPVLVYEGKILDGRNRFKACIELGINPKTEDYEGGDPLTYVMSTNLQRRHLNESQKAIVGRRYKQYYSKFAKERQGTRTDIVELVPQGLEPARARDEAGEVVGVSGRYIDMAEEVISKRPELEEKIMAGELKIKTALRDIKLEEQKEEIKKLKPEKELKGVYDIIVIDPPWSYNDDDNYDPDTRRGTTPYPTMSIEQIKSIDIPSSDNSVIFLWTTQKHLWYSKEILDSYGFEYKAILVWDKEKMGIGKWFRMQCEFCLLGIKGKPHWGITDMRDILKEPRTTHSKKPEGFYNLIDDYFDNSFRKLDYFNRDRKREGWDSYGN